MILAGFWGDELGSLQMATPVAILRAQCSGLCREARESLVPLMTGALLHGRVLGICRDIAEARVAPVERAIALYDPAEFKSARDAYAILSGLKLGQSVDRPLVARLS